jgi:Na+/melibiose symporter-like transporter
LTLFVLWELRVDEPMLDMRYFRSPAFSTGTGGMILIFLAMYGVMFLITQYFQLVLDYSPLGAALRLLPIAPIMIIVSPMTPRLAARFGAHRTVASGMVGITIGFLLFAAIGTHTPYLYVLIALIPLVTGMALSMSPMTASIMSAVPTRRAGSGSATNDATRELGAALGVAVLGSLAASKYASSLSSVLHLVPAADHAKATSSIAGAIQVAQGLPASAARTVTLAAQQAWVDGIQLAVIVGAVLSTIAAVIVWRFLPHSLAPESALHGPVEAMEEAAELGIAGVPPAFADQEPEPSEVVSP